MKLDDYYVWGSIFFNNDPIHGIKVKLENVLPNLDTFETISNNFYTFENIPTGTFTIRPVSEEYFFEPSFIQLYFNKSYGPIYFYATPTSSVRENKNFEIKNNVLISKEFVGMQYHIFSLTGRVVKSGILPKELNLNVEHTGTYILQVTKGEQVIYLHKFQVVR